jgi:hypothetical protein
MKNREELWEQFKEAGLKQVGEKSDKTYDFFTIMEKKYAELEALCVAYGLSLKEYQILTCAMEGKMNDGEICANLGIDAAQFDDLVAGLKAKDLIGRKKGVLVATVFLGPPSLILPLAFVSTSSSPPRISARIRIAAVRRARATRRSLELLHDFTVSVAYVRPCLGRRGSTEGKCLLAPQSANCQRLERRNNAECSGLRSMRFLSPEISRVRRFGGR